MGGPGRKLGLAAMSAFAQGAVKRPLHCLLNNDIGPRAALFHPFCNDTVTHLPQPGPL